MKWVGLIAELAYDLAREAWRDRKRKQAAAKAWAERPAPIRGCPRCGEIAYTPGQVACGRCGALL
jgi:hypothetical protein